LTNPERDRITWIASYPRSGNTWLRFLVANCLVDHEFDWGRAMNSFAFELYYYLEQIKREGWTTQDVIDTMRRVVKGQPTGDRIGDRLFMKTHNAWSGDHPFSELGGPAVLLVRDPRDVLLSAANYYNLTRDPDADQGDYARRYIDHGGDLAWINAGYGTWYEHYQSWADRSDFPVHVVRYETLKTNPVPALVDLCEFLGFDVTEADAQRAVERTDMAKMRDIEKKARDDGSFGGLNDGYNFFNKGKSGQALDDLGPGLDDLFEQKFANELAEMGYTRSARA